MLSLLLLDDEGVLVFDESNFDGVLRLEKFDCSFWFFAEFLRGIAAGDGLVLNL